MIQTYREWVPRVAGEVSVLDQLPSAWASGQVRMVVQAVIDAEAPIHKDKLARVVAGAFGLGRISEDRKRAIERVVPSEYRRETDNEFYWPRGVDPLTWRVVRRPRTGVSRPLDEVSLVEIGNAMIIVAEKAGGIEPAELSREVLNMLGGRRLTPGVKARLDDALKHALARGVLRQSVSGLVAVG